MHEEAWRKPGPSNFLRETSQPTSLRTSGHGFADDDGARGVLEMATGGRRV